MIRETLGSKRASPLYSRFGGSIWNGRGVDDIRSRFRRSGLCSGPRPRSKH